MEGLEDAPDTLLIEMAATAFRMGLEDGRTKKKPDDALGIRARLDALSDDRTWMKLHRIKFRQVYGAAFDMVAVPIKVRGL